MKHRTIIEFQKAENFGMITGVTGNLVENIDYTILSETEDVVTLGIDLDLCGPWLKVHWASKPVDTRMFAKKVVE